MRSLSSALEAPRPDFEMLAAGPEDLDEATLRLSPQVVVCSQVTAVVEAEASAWIELYPDHSSRAVVRLNGERSTFPGMDLETFLATADRAGKGARPD